MRLLNKLFLGLATLAIGFAGSLSWLLFFSRDLPDVDRLAGLNPTSNSLYVDPCLPEGILALPWGEIPKHLRDALVIVEPVRSQRFQLARNLLCDSGNKRPLRYALDTWRLAVRLRWRYSDHEIQTIYANRPYFDGYAIGVEAAARHFFGKSARDVTLVEAALLAGLPRSPALFSPSQHSDLAFERRN